MAYQKLQASSGLAVIPSDEVDIPNPAAEIRTASTTSAVAGKLVDSNADFVALGVKIGDIIYDNTNNIAAKVNKVDSDTELSVSTAIPNGANYTIYAQRDMPSNGCVLYIGGAGNVALRCASRSKIVIFKGLVAGQFVPVQTLRVNSSDTTATDIVALW